MQKFFIWISIFATGVSSVYGSSNGTKTLSEKLNDGAAEVANLSPIAFTLIIGPVIVTFVLGIICYCVCCKVRKIARDRTTDFAGITVLKAPPGQPAPIPLTGMVNQHGGRGCNPAFPKLVPAPTFATKNMTR